MLHTYLRFELGQWAIERFRSLKKSSSLSRRCTPWATLICKQYIISNNTHTISVQPSKQYCIVYSGKRCWFFLDKWAHNHPPSVLQVIIPGTHMTLLQWLLQGRLAIFHEIYCSIVVKLQSSPYRWQQPVFTSLSLVHFLSVPHIVAVQSHVENWH